MWLHVRYEPVAAFGLRPSNTTSTGGKSLLCPTPYAIKMALLDRLIRERGSELGRATFPLISSLKVWIRLPRAVAVNRTFQKVQRGWDNKTRSWTSTIAQREYCFHAGAFDLAFEAVPDDVSAHMLMEIASAVNYFGWRGSFMQFAGAEVSHSLSGESSFVNLSLPTQSLQIGGFLQRMDDMRSDVTFEDVSVLNPKATGGRVSYTVVLPYQLVYHGPNHTVYAWEPVS